MITGVIKNKVDKIWTDSCSEKGKAIRQGMEYCRWHIQDQVVSFWPEQEDEHVRDKKN